MRNIRIKSPLGDGVLQFERMVGHEALGTAFEYRATVLSEDPNIELAKILGQKATITVELTRDTQRYFNGYVTSFAYVGTAGALARYELTMRPWFWLLSLGSNCRVFQNKDAVAIAKEIWSDAGFTDVREALSGKPYPKLEYSVQYRESDFNYVSRLLEHEGIYYFFEHDQDKHTLVLADSPEAHKPFPKYEKVRYLPPTSVERRRIDHLSSWTVGQQMRPGAYCTTDYDFTRPRADLTSRLKMPAPHSLADFEVFDYPGRYVESPAGEKQVKVRLEEYQSDQQVVTAGGDVMGLSSGASFTLTDFPREDENVEHVVVAATYQLQTNAYASGAAGEIEHQGSYILIPKSNPYRVPAHTVKPKVDGPQTAVVTGKSGEEIWTDKYGRIKVQFHWDRLGKNDEESSCWVRVAQNWAGSKWGALFLPRIGQEVIVDFLEGDPDQPIVIGRVYNGTNMPPYDLPANQTQSGIKTRSSKGGTPDNFNEIRFEDKKGSELLAVQAEKDQTTLVKHDQQSTIKNNKKVTVEKQYNLIVNEKYDIKVGPGVHITAENSGKLNVTALQEIKLQCGPASITLRVDGSVQVTGTIIKVTGATVSISGMPVSINTG
jgi:type VI secretion system secreted protein VgrG